MGSNHIDNSPLAFNIPDRELPNLINQYKADLEAGAFPRASWPHFCAFLGFTEKEVAACIERGSREPNAYTRRALLLKRMLTWMRGEMLSGTGWSGQNQTKAIFALKQNMGDNVSYADQPAQTGPTKVEISFGGDDPRRRKAAK